MSEIFYIDEEEDKEVCFKHAVQAVMIEDKAIKTKLDESVFWQLHQCYMCERNQELKGVKSHDKNTKDDN